MVSEEHHETIIKKRENITYIPVCGGLNNNTSSFLRFAEILGGKERKSRRMKTVNMKVCGCGVYSMV